MIEENTKLPESFDARDWAEEFVRIAKQNPHIPQDEECIIGWFANALMRGFDEHGSRIAKEENGFIYCQIFKQEVSSQHIQNSQLLINVIEITH